MRLRTRQDYQSLARSCERLVGRWIILEIKTNKAKGTRLGLTVKRQYGCAVERNRFKRLAREAFRLSYETLPKNLDIVIKPRSFALNANLNDLLEELNQLLFEINLAQLHNLPPRPQSSHEIT